jgi:HEAT repeat protein
VPPGQGVEFAPAAASGQTPDEVLAQLARDPQGPNVGDLLAVVGRQVENATRANRVEQALAVLAAVVQEESRVTDTSARRHYSIALRRMYTKALLKAVAQLLAAPAHRDAAVVVLRRAGADAVELLIERLVAAQSIGERRAVFDALRQMSEGRGQLIQMLTHHQWFVVRNVAELVGEMGMEQAVPALAKQIEHDDERVRKAVALALAKIGSGSAAEPLRRALRDKSAEVRIQVAVGVGGRRSSSLAMPLVVALGDEKDETVQRELLLALGRIGTADAVQALIKVAQPAGRLFGRKPSPLRVAAVEGLRLAATAPAVGTLEGLAGDGDRQVSAAAQEALQDLKSRKKP